MSVWMKRAVVAALVVVGANLAAGTAQADHYQSSYGYGGNGHRGNYGYGGYRSSFSYSNGSTGFSYRYGPYGSSYSYYSAPRTNYGYGNGYNSARPRYSSGYSRCH